MDAKFARQIGPFEESVMRINPPSIAVLHAVGHVFEEEIVEKAWEYTIKTVPNLRMKIDLIKYPYEIQETDNFLKYSFIKADNADQWKEIVRLEMNKRIRYEEGSNLAYLIIVQFLEHAYIMIKGDHCNFDGGSVGILANAFLDFYSKLIRKEEITISQFPFVPNIEKFIFQQEQIECEKKESVTSNKPLEYKIEDSNENYFLTYEGSEENLQKLKVLSKAKGITIGAILLASVYFNIAKISNQNWEEDSEKKISFSYDINMRPKLGLGLKDVGLLICINSTPEITITKETDYWDLCSTVNKALRNLSEPEIKKIYERISSQQEENEPSICNFSNVGLFPFPLKYSLNEGNQFSIENIYATGKWCPGFAKFVFVIFTLSKMNFTITHDGTLDTEMFDSIVNLAENCHKFDNLTFEDYLKLNRK